MLNELEQQLRRRGFSSKVRRVIKNSKICIIDDKIDDLKSLIEGLRNEGFTNLVEKRIVRSINELIEEQYDLLILDLSGIATAVSSDDGVGVLTEIKKNEPTLPILVVSGATTSPIYAKKISLADAIRAKPVLPADLASDVEELLKYKKDEYWAALSILQELRRLNPELNEELNYYNKLQLRLLQFRIRKDIDKANPGIVNKLLKIGSIVSKLGTTTINIVKIANGIPN